MMMADADDDLRLGVVLDAMAHAVMIFDVEARVVFANACAARTFGLPRSRLVGAQVDSLLAPESRSMWRAALAQMDQPGRKEALDVFGAGELGARLTFELTLRRIDATSGRCLALVEMRDVTEQRRAALRRALASAEEGADRERLETMLEFAPAFILGLSRAGTIDFISRTLPQYARQDVIGVPWRQFIQPEGLREMEIALEEMYATGATQTYEVATSVSDGSTRWFSSQVAPIRAAGEVVGAVVVSQDVTDKKRTQAELVAGRQMALLGTLAAGVAHEINTPIQYVGDSIQFLSTAATSLLGLLDKLQNLLYATDDGTPASDAIRVAAEAEAAADLPYLRENLPLAFESSIDGLNRVATIVRSLKEFAHPPAAKMVSVDINHTVQSALTIATNEYKHVADIEVDFGDVPPIPCHPNEITQVVLNVLVNAAHAIGDVVKSTDRKGLLTVRTRQEGDSVVIAIQDTGAGIPDELRSRVFDPFFTTKAVGKGTGQGLAIAWSTVKDRHGGELYFETKMGEGTIFFICLPVARPALAA